MGIRMNSPHLVRHQVRGVQVVIGVHFMVNACGQCFRVVR